MKVGNLQKNDVGQWEIENLKLTSGDPVVLRSGLCVRAAQGRFTNF